MFILFLELKYSKSLNILSELQIEGAKITSLFSETAVLPPREFPRGLKRSCGTPNLTMALNKIYVFKDKISQPHKWTATISQPREWTAGIKSYS